MLTLIALSAVLMQDPPAPPPPPEVHTRVMVMGPHGPGSLDKDGDGQVSREEFAAPMNEHFGRIDTDGDGRLSTGELASGPDMAGDRNVMAWSGEGADSGPGGERTMMFMGRHGGERMEHEIVVHGGPGAPHMIHAPGHDGPAGETRVEVRTLGGHGEHHGPGDMDKDGDGKVSEAEFIAPLRDAFARMDADRSGFIEEGEHGGDRDVRVFTHRIETRDED
ncbi:MAG: EF-hand domain-containing protein [Brevundimonas sp.]|nr:EF-hand domain-containing protein [Brevundimonas sp.]